MSNITVGIIAGVVFGLVAVATMIPMKFPNKRAALLAAFINRFAIGFLIVVAVLPVDPWLKGLLIALVLSLPEAIITGAYAPILGMGVIGGILIGLITGAR